MELFTTHLPGGGAFRQTREYQILNQVCSSVNEHLSPMRSELTDAVARRVAAMGILLGFRGEELVRLEAAARIHRLGELFLDEGYRNKSFIDMSDSEIMTYRSYPIFSALRVSSNVHGQVYDILLRHREYVCGDGFLRSDTVEQPIGARILCVATEYEEQVAYHGHDAIAMNTIQAQLTDGAHRRYDPEVLDVLMRTICAENVVH